jgi:hypothetical protein
MNEHAERIEVIGPGGRLYVGYFEPGIRIELQDDGRTLKLFVERELTNDELIERWRPHPDGSIMERAQKHAEEIKKRRSE